MDLLVRSEKIDCARPVESWGTCSTAHLSSSLTGDSVYTSKGVTRCFFPEDKEAVDFLSDKGVSFNLIDLSELSFIERVKARIEGIDKTPILILDNGTRLKGMEQIRNTVELIL
ncbi:hypothetical protein GTO27_09510 [Candidatus Bathyarchaeota archaeon]|nr:hypothetical protein [Candidatus Bathyarchaeota archaeon]